MASTMPSEMETTIHPQFRFSEAEVDYLGVFLEEQQPLAAPHVHNIEAPDGAHEHLDYTAVPAGQVEDEAAAQR